MKFQSSKQLYDMFYDHTKQGRDCIYLCHHYRDCDYMIQLMASMFEPEAVSRPKLMLSYKGTKVMFKSTDYSPDRVLSGPPVFLLLDHAAIKKLNIVKRVEWKHLVNHNNERIMANVC